MNVVFALNPVIRAAAENTQMGWLLAVTTVFFMVAFLGWIWVAYNPANRERWEQAGRMPLDDSLPGGDA